MYWYVNVLNGVKRMIPDKSLGGQDPYKYFSGRYVKTWGHKIDNTNVIDIEVENLQVYELEDYA